VQTLPQRPVGQRFQLHKLCLQQQRVKEGLCGTGGSWAPVHASWRAGGPPAVLCSDSTTWCARACRTSATRCTCCSVKHKPACRDSKPPTPADSASHWQCMPALVGCAHCHQAHACQTALSAAPHASRTRIATRSHFHHRPLPTPLHAPRHAHHECGYHSHTHTACTACCAATMAAAASVATTTPPSAGPSSGSGTAAALAA
jgi:hypothetical protein